jgi:hypothetical protein
MLTVLAATPRDPPWPPAASPARAASAATTFLTRSRFPVVDTSTAPSNGRASIGPLRAAPDAPSKRSARAPPSRSGTLPQHGPRYHHRRAYSLLRDEATPSRRNRHLDHPARKVVDFALPLSSRSCSIPAELHLCTGFPARPQGTLRASGSFFCWGKRRSVFCKFMSGSRQPYSHHKAGERLREMLLIRAPKPESWAVIVREQPNVICGTNM